MRIRGARCPAGHRCPLCDTEMATVMKLAQHYPAAYADWLAGRTERHLRHLRSGPGVCTTKNTVAAETARLRGLGYTSDELRVKQREAILRRRGDEPVTAVESPDRVYSSDDIRARLRAAILQFRQV